MIKFLRKTHPVYLIVDLWCILISFWIPYVLYFNSFSDIFTKIHLPNFPEYCFIFFLELTLVIIVFKRKRLYSTNREITIFKELLYVITRIFSVEIIVGSVIFFAHYLFFSRFVFVINFILLILFLGGWRILKRLILRKLIREGFRNINVLIIGAGDVAKVVLEEIRRRPYYGFKVVGILDENISEPVGDTLILGTPADFVEVVQKYFIDEIIIASSDKEIISKLITQAQNLRLGIRVVFEQPEKTSPVLDLNFMGTLPLFTYKTRELHPSESLSKKVFDFAVSLILISLLSPMLIIIAILIKVSSPGPVFFVQKRVGLKGKVFNFHKFRSMVENADELKSELLARNEIVDGVMFKIKDDPRVTKTGKFLRKYSLDELPQLFNVLTGDMSLVGPRPPLPSEIEEYDSLHMNRLSIKPGMTGLSQVRGRSDLSSSRWFKWDLWYISNWSFGLDIKILLSTLPVVLKGKGAY